MTKNKNNEQWLDEIRRSVADYKEDIPSDGWEQYLGSRKGLKTSPAIGYRRFSIFLRSAAALLLLVIALGAFYKYIGTKEAELVANLPVQNDIPADPVIAQQENEKESEDNHVISKNVVSSKIAKAKPRKVVMNDEVVVVDSKPAEVSEDKPKLQEKIADSKEPIADSKETIINSEEKELLLAMEQNTLSRKASSSQLSLKMRLGTGGDSFTKLGSSFEGSVRDRDLSYDSSMASNNMSFGCMSDGDSTKISNTRAAEQNFLYQQQDEDVALETDNHMSWSFGFEVQKSLTERLSLESGIVYTLLTSDVRMKYSGVKKQQMHYLGVPLKLNVELAQRDNWQFYVGGGGMLERCIYATRGGKSFSNKEWQWSVVGAVGFQYMISRHIGIYFEPGVNYYFDDHSGIENFRSAQPFTFNIQAGVKFR